MATGVVEWATCDPDRVAFVHPDRSVTIGELNETAGALAGRVLDAEGPGADAGGTWLPVVVDRTLNSGVALHAAIRAGRAWAPIESHLPKAAVAELFSRLG